VKPILCLFLALCAGLWADEASDRMAIGQVIATLNEPADTQRVQPFSGLFTADADSSDRDRLANLIGLLQRYPNQPWSEVTTPRFGTPSIRFITPDVALVDVPISQYGSIIGAHRRPVYLVMRKEGTAWRIAAVRTSNDRARLSIVPVACHPKRGPIPTILPSRTQRESEAIAI
jgi:hypothetical protein